jgi:hypothetical protein
MKSEPQEQAQNQSHWFSLSIVILLIITAALYISYLHA